jgi:hypothetical protein
MSLDDDLLREDNVRLVADKAYNIVLKLLEHLEEPDRRYLLIAIGQRLIEGAQLSARVDLAKLHISG